LRASMRDTMSAGDAAAALKTAVAVVPPDRHATLGKLAQYRGNRVLHHSRSRSVGSGFGAAAGDDSFDSMRARTAALASLYAQL
jgi:hypothetical protein